MIVLDTWVLVFGALAPHRLSSAAETAIAEAARTRSICISDISLWEVAMLVERGRLVIDADSSTFLRHAIAASGIDVLPISPEIAGLSTSLQLHGDPADRLIAATAVHHKAVLVTSDRKLREAPGVRTVW